jgi:hypothetical protein
MKTRLSDEKSDQGWDGLFIAMEGGRAACDGDAYSQFQLKRGSDGTKRCQKMKWR